MKKHIFAMSARSALSLSLPLVLLGGACATPVQSGTIADQRAKQPVVDTIKTRSVAGQLDPAAIEKIKDLNLRAGKPRFGLIGAYYQLPLARPAGATRVSGNVMGIPYDQTQVVPDSQRPWALQPAAAGDLEMLQSSLNALLDAGVQWTEVSMADASQLIAAEQQASGGNSLADFNKLSPSGVDLLVSIHKGRGLAGPLFVGRVVRTSDGAMLALGTQIDAGAVSLRPLIMQLVEDSLRRQAENPPTAP